MKRIAYILILVAFLGILLYAWHNVSHKAINTYKDDIARLQNEISNLEYSIDSIRRINKEFITKNDSLIQRLRERTRQLTNERNYWDERIKAINSANAADVAYEFWQLTGD